MISTFSETTAWKNVVTKTYNLKCLNIGSMRFYSSNNDEYVTAPYATDSGEIKETRFNFDDKYKYLIKSRNLLDLEGNIILEKSYYTFDLPLTNEDDVWNNFIKSKTRNQIRKGLKNDFQIKIGNLDLLDDFYYVISRAWRDLGTPTHSKKFYKNILEEFKDKAELIVIYINKKPASSAILLYQNNVIAHPYAATLRKYNRLSLNNVLYWSIIKRGIEKGCKTFDMGRSHKNQGTFKFKKSWGAKPIPLYYYYLNYNKIPDFDSKLMRFLTDTWSKLPLKFTTILGPYFIRKVL